MRNGRFKLASLAANRVLCDQAQHSVAGSLRQSGTSFSYFAKEFVTPIPGPQTEVIDLTLSDSDIVIDLSED
jgi:hypothetical protein